MKITVVGSGGWGTALAMLLLENMPSGNQPGSIQRSKGTENIFPSGEELDSIKKQAAENGKLIQDRSLYFLSCLHKPNLCHPWSQS